MSICIRFAERHRYRDLYSEARDSSNKERNSNLEAKNVKRNALLRD